MKELEDKEKALLLIGAVALLTMASRPPLVTSTAPPTGAPEPVPPTLGGARVKLEVQPGNQVTVKAEEPVTVSYADQTVALKEGESLTVKGSELPATVTPVQDESRQTQIYSVETPTYVPTPTIPTTPEGLSAYPPTLSPEAKEMLKQVVEGVVKYPDVIVPEPPPLSVQEKETGVISPDRELWTEAWNVQYVHMVEDWADYMRRLQQTVVDNAEVCRTMMEKAIARGDMETADYWRSQMVNELSKLDYYQRMEAQYREWLSRYAR